MVRLASLYRLRRRRLGVCRALDRALSISEAVYKEGTGYWEVAIVREGRSRMGFSLRPSL